MERATCIPVLHAKSAPKAATGFSRERLQMGCAAFYHCGKHTACETTLTTKRVQNAGSKMKAACNFIAIDCLVARVGKKLPVDIVGIVTAVTPLSSVKRTADGSEILRRCALCNCH